MLTSVETTSARVGATDVKFINSVLSITLTDGREINVPMDRVDWLAWLRNATVEQRSKWSLEPNGYAVYWEELDDGIEICHLLEMKPLV